jgi:diaminopimelate epimerase
MMPIFPILLIVVLGMTDGLALGEAAGAPLRWMAPAFLIGPVVVHVALLWCTVRSACRLMRTGRGASRAVTADRLLRLTPAVALMAHAVSVLALGWLDIVRSVVGDLVLVDELIAIAPALSAPILAWIVFYPVERRFRDAVLIRRLDLGLPIYQAPSRWRYVLTQIRLNLLLTLPPVAVLLAWSEAAREVATWQGLGPPWVIEIVVIVGSLTVFAVAPLIARLVLDVDPLPPGELRDDLLGVCRAHRVGVRELLVWHTDGSSINAAVMGLLAPLRYVMLTDALLDSLPRPQLLAVMAHEVGHVRRRHLWWLAAALLALAMALEVGLGLILGRHRALPRAVGRGGSLGGMVLCLRRLRSHLPCVRLGQPPLRASGRHFCTGASEPCRRRRCGGGGRGVGDDRSARVGGAAQRDGSEPSKLAAWLDSVATALSGEPGRPAVGNPRHQPNHPLDEDGGRDGAGGRAGLAGGGRLARSRPAAADRATLPLMAHSMRELPFIKMHGIGNDYVYVNGFEHDVAEPESLARKVADRHFGVGGDGLILVLPPERGVAADVRMRMFNADGSESEMCGNGIRCVCKFAHDQGLSTANPMKIQTGAGVLTLRYTTGRDGLVEQVTVDMGEPRLALPEIPVLEKALAGRGAAHSYHVDVGALPERWTGVFVSMGNPHVVFFEDENPGKWLQGLESFDLARIGPLLENHAAFPRRINVHMVRVHSRSELTMRTWERGSGLTLACGTGAAAVCVASALTGRTDRRVLAHLPGGDLTLEWDEATNHVFKTGPATEVFQGVWRGAANLVQRVSASASSVV